MVDTSPTATADEPLEEGALRSRRAFVGTAGLAIGTVLTGCTASETDGRTASGHIIEETARVKPGEHEAFEFELDASQWVTVSASLSDRSVDVKKDGPGVDVVIMTIDQYSQFQRERQFEYVGEVSMPDVVTGQVSGTLDPGSYVALVDNSNTGSAKPGNADTTGVVNLDITRWKMNR
jgi:hypothetical protein